MKQDFRLGEKGVLLRGREEVLRINSEKKMKKKRINSDILETERRPHLMEENNEFLYSILDIWDLKHFNASVFNSTKALK